MCNHEVGDFIMGNWVCAQCFTALHERPVRYGLSPGDSGDRQRQEIVWQAAIAKTSEGVKFSKFMAWMTGYVRLHSLFTIDKHEVLDMCLEALRDMGEPFGNPDCCWDREDAREIVRESIFAYWDEEGAGSNA